MSLCFLHHSLCKNTYVGEGEAGGETCDSREGQNEGERDSDSKPQSSTPDTSE